jgi:predicted phage terminase large subunit-like protein
MLELGPRSATLSPIDRLAALPEGQRREACASLSAAERAQALYAWRLWARPDQLPPAEGWRVWLLRGGRGSGKTRAGAEWVRGLAEAGSCRRIALVGRTWADVRDVMVCGESGMLAVCPPWSYPDYQVSRRQLLWPNGVVAKLYSADEPDSLRGPQHDAAWCDEAASWHGTETWHNLMLGLRKGRDPRCVVTTTPRPTVLIRELVARATTAETRATTYENLSNLAAGFFEDIVSAYEGTRLGQQEIHGELLEDVVGALWNHALIEELRVSPERFAPGGPEAAAWQRVVVAVDPAVTCGEDSDETGIIVAALGKDGHCYVLADASGRLESTPWARRVVALFEVWKADHVVVETNNGGDLVPQLLHRFAPNLPVRKVTASRGKVTRAEPVSALYDTGRAHHVGCFPALEAQMTAFTPDIDRASQGSPDRVDALVWAISDLLRRPPQKARCIRLYG